MTTRAFSILILAILGLSSVPSPDHAQQSPSADTSARRVQMLPSPVPVHSPMVFALVSDSFLNHPDSTFGPARQVTESLGFSFGVKAAAHFAVADSRYAAVYYLPTDVSRGYLIIIPGHRPDIVRGYVAADSLRQRIMRYRQLIRPLTPGQ
jgi:hypothetical protein